MSGLKPMTDAETAMTIAAMNPGVSEAQAALVIGLLRHNGWLSPADLPEHERLTQRAEQAERERDLAIAHDRQPYPTAWAYEQACKALEAQRQRVEQAREIHRRACHIADGTLKHPVDACEMCIALGLPGEPVTGDDVRDATAPQDRTAEENEAAVERVRAIPREPHSSEQDGELGRAYTRGWQSVIAAIDTALDRTGSDTGAAEDFIRQVEDGQHDKPLADWEREVMTKQYVRNVLATWDASRKGSDDLSELTDSLRALDQQGEPVSDATVRDAIAAEPRRLTEQQGGIPNDAITGADMAAARKPEETK